MTAAFLLKAPVPGLVKTRLAADIGNVAACEAYRALVERQLVEIPPDWNIHIFYTAADADHAFRQWLGADLTLSPQPDGDLGDRQEAAVVGCLPDSVALIGGDCPYLSTSILKAVEAGLDSHDLSVVPAVDGGYVTLAMKQWYPGLFANITWSTETVAHQLSANAYALGASLQTLAPLEDVDTIHEWQRACTAFPALKS